MRAHNIFSRNPLFLAALLLGMVVLVSCRVFQPSPAPQVEITVEAPRETQPVTSESPQPVPEMRAIPVINVQVQTGVGSPIPVEAFVSGEWPDLCAQLAAVEQTFIGNRVEITLLATPLDPSCPPDHLGLPFRIAIPLNMVELPQDSYSVAVNGVETSFDWHGSGHGQPEPAGASSEPRSIPVENVQVEVGVGSPIPVDVVVSGTWPDLCAQISRIEQHFSGQAIEISLLASPPDPTCPPDNLGLPFRLAIPLNIAQMPVGEYALSVNGVQTSFEWTGQPGATFSASPENIVYIGADGNIWAGNRLSDAQRQVTTDGRSMYLTVPLTDTMVSYYFPAISSDGAWVAYRRDVSTPVPSGIQSEYGMWAANLVTGESRQIISQHPAGLAWKPGTHLLTYGLGVADGYFTLGGQVNSELATGIWAVDLDGGDPVELVRPERGFSLARPLWSPDGSGLGFEEVSNYEGSGMFAYYDLEASEYQPWENPLGIVDLSPAGAQIAYDFAIYTLTGEERVYLNSMAGGTEQQFSPEPEQGFAYYPAFSPQGDRLAYLSGTADPDSQVYTLVVQDLAGGEPQELGTFDEVHGLGWSPDGSSLIFSAGKAEAHQILALSLADGTTTVLAQGTNPAVTMP